MGQNNCQKQLSYNYVEADNQPTKYHILRPSQFGRPHFQKSGQYLENYAADL